MHGCEEWVFVGPFVSGDKVVGTLGALAVRVRPNVELLTSGELVRVRVDLQSPISAETQLVLKIEGIDSGNNPFIIPSFFVIGNHSFKKGGFLVRFSGIERK